MKKSILLILILVITSALIYFAISKDNNSNKNIDENVTPVAQNEEERDTTANIPETNTPPVQTDEIYRVFSEIGVSISVPKELDVIQTPNYNDTEARLDSYTFYIQEYQNEGAIDFQIYGLYQFDIPETTWNELSEIKTDTTNYEYVKEISINGIRGYDTKLSGERGNYLYMFLLDNHVLRIAVSPATPENKVRADSIIETLTLL